MDKTPLYYALSLTPTKNERTQKTTNRKGKENCKGTLKSHIGLEVYIPF